MYSRDPTQQVGHNPLFRLAKNCGRQRHLLLRAGNVATAIQDLSGPFDCTTAIAIALSTREVVSFNLSDPTSKSVPTSSVIILEDSDLENAHFRLNVQDLINAYHPNILIILEPRINNNHAEQVIGQVGLPQHFRVDPIGLSSGIWVL